MGDDVSIAESNTVRLWRPAGCQCDFRTYMVGDGCHFCSPRLAAFYEQDQTPPEPCKVDAAGTYIGEAE